MNLPARTCQATRADGTPCRRTPAAGDKWCAHHQKKYSRNVKHGNYADPELLNLPRGKHITFEEFMSKESPYDLRPAIAYLWTILTEQREAINRMSKVNLEDLKDIYVSQVEEDLLASGLEDEELAKELAKISTDRFMDAVKEHYGETSILGPAHYAFLTDTIDKLAKTCERAKKINDGIVINVSYKGVHSALMKGVTKVLQLFPEPEKQMEFVNAIREMNLLGKYERAQVEHAIEAEFEELDFD